MTGDVGNVLAVLALGGEYIRVSVLYVSIYISI